MSFQAASLFLLSLFLGFFVTAWIVFTILIAIRNSERKLTGFALVGVVLAEVPRSAWSVCRRIFFVPPFPA